MSETLPPTVVDTPEARRNRLIVLGLILITLFCYWQVGKSDFVNYDDPKYITNNPDVQKGFNSDMFRYAFTSIDGGYRHPLTWFSHHIDIELFGPKRSGPALMMRLLGTNEALPAGHHLVNLVFHLADTLLLFYVLKRLTARDWAAAWVAAAFAVHPTHVESVAWISERKDVLSTLFFLLTILAYLRYVEWPSAKRYAVVVAAFIGALMCKPMMITLPGVLLILNLWPLRRITFDGTFWQSLKRPARETLPLLVFSVISGAISVHDTAAQRSIYTLAEWPLSLRLATSVIGYARYLGKLFWPTKLVVFYPTPDSWPLTWVVAATALCLVITVLTVWRAKRQPYLLFGWLWFLGTLLPVIGMVPTGDASLGDRYTYISFIGPFIALAWWMMDVFRSQRAVLAGLGAAALVACIAQTYRQVGVWQDSRSLMWHGMQVSPGNWGVTLNYAVALTNTKDDKKAGPYYAEAVRLRPQSGLTNTNYARYLLNQNKVDEAAPYLLAARKIDPDDLRCLAQIGRLQAMMGQHAKAISIFDYILKKKPQNPDVELLAAYSYYALLKPAEAEVHIRKALDLEPTLANAHYQLGKLAAERMEGTEAMRCFERAIECKPDYGLAHLDYGIALAAARRYDDAMPQLQTALETLRDSELAEQSLAELTIGKILEKVNRPLEAAAHFIRALDLAQKAVDESPRDPMPRYELAARLKQVGRESDAESAARTAWMVAQKNGNAYFMNRLRQQFPLVVPTTMPSSEPSTLPTTQPSLIGG